MKYVFTALLLTLAIALSAQITGQVVDDAKLGLPAASVALYQGDALITGVSTNNNGSFTLEAPAGTYRLEISFVSFKKHNQTITLKADAELKLGAIELQPATANLDAVTVEAEAAMMQFEQDKRVFNVGKDLANIGSNASDILDNIPSVTVDVEGQVSLRGSQNVRILVNGKPSGLIGSDPAAALRQLQGNMIERIEVITNPSARYDAEGEAGIINIILKKQDKAGLNGSFNLQAGYPDLYGVGASLNYRKNKLNWFTNLSFDYNRAPGGGFSNQQFFFNDTTYSFERDRDQLRGGIDATLRFGADYNISESQTLTTSFLYSPSRDNNLVDLQYRDFTQGNELIQTVNRNDDETETEATIEGTLSWAKQFKNNKDHKWTADFRFTSEIDREQSIITEDTVDRTGTFRQDVDNLENQQSFLLQTDYVRPFGDDKSFETGSRLTLRTINNDYALSNIAENGTLNPVDSFTNAFTFTENVYAIYAIYNGKVKQNLTYQGGLRAEYTNIITELDSGATNQRDYLNLFPSAFITYKFNPRNDLQLSYSRRISRPGFWTLAPFFGFSDNRNFFSGNPNVNPEFTDSYELGYVRYFEKGSLYSGVYYRHRTGVIERISTVDENGFTRIFPINLAVQDAYGFEFNLQYDFTKWYSVNGNLNLFRAITTGEYQGQSFDADNYSSSGRLVNRLKFWNSDFQLSFNLRGAAITPQGRSLGRYTMDLGWSKDILKNKGTLTLSVRDLFNTNYRRTYTSGENFESFSQFQWRQRQLTLTFNYRLNQAKSRRPEGGGPPEGGGGDF